MTDAERAVIEAAKAWAPTRLTRTNSGNRDRLKQAVDNLKHEEQIRILDAGQTGANRKSDWK